MIITRIEATDYLCLRSVKQDLGPFQFLVGPNGGGKSAFMDVLAFMGSLVAGDLDKAVAERTQDFQDLVWGREGTSFRLGLTAQVGERGPGGPQEDRRKTICYQVSVRLDSKTDLPGIAEKSAEVEVPLAPHRLRVAVLSRKYETIETRGEAAEPPLMRAISRSLSGLPHFPREEKYAEALRLSNLLARQVQYVKLDVAALRKPSPPLRVDVQRFDGSTLARVVNQLKEDAPENFESWLAHVRTAAPHLDSVRSVLRPEDKHRWLMIRYAGGKEVPSWMESEGILRLLALTVLAYVPEPSGVYLIEEPENGVHPMALETIYQSLSSIYECQVLVATHSPVLLAMASPEEVLCFRRTPEGTEIVRGSEHPALRDWQGEVNLAEYFAAGVLG